MKQIITLSSNAAERIKQIMSEDKHNSIGVRVGVKSGGCAGMSYVMEYTKVANPNDEVIEDKGIKLFIDPSAVMSFHHLLYLKTLMKQNAVDVESHLKYKYPFWAYQLCINCISKVLSNNE